MPIADALVPSIITAAAALEVAVDLLEHPARGARQRVEAAHCGQLPPDLVFPGGEEGGGYNSKGRSCMRHDGEGYQRAGWTAAPLSHSLAIYLQLRFRNTASGHRTDL